MTNYIRGDLLLYTNKGIKRIDKLNKSDFNNLSILFNPLFVYNNKSPLI